MNKLNKRDYKKIGEVKILITDLLFAL